MVVCAVVAPVLPPACALQGASANNKQVAWSCHKLRMHAEQRQMRGPNFDLRAQPHL